uniref:Uncharacterized protein n=1 Tax=Lepeophtheirus salmonis TaxID=72036 RepID=A0A0K2VF73_LEPSM
MKKVSFPQLKNDIPVIHGARQEVILGVF